MITIFGWLATFITLTYKLPQMLKLYKVKKTDGLSIISYSIQAIGYIFYTLHGFFIKDNPILFMGLASTFQSIILISMYFYYNKNTVTDVENVNE